MCTTSHTTGNTFGGKAEEMQSPEVTAQLLAIVEVDHDQRVSCGNPGCGHSVHKAIHLVQDGQRLLVLGSSCFKKRYGAAPLGQPRYSGGAGRKLSTEERDLLLNNTAALVEQFEREREASLHKLRVTKVAFAARANARGSSQSESLPSPENKTLVYARSPVKVSSARRAVPWTWMKPGTSMAGFKLKDGTAWVRVQHVDGRQLLTPWPTFDGWDEWLPAHLGSPEHALGAYVVIDLRETISFVRSRAVRERVSGLWAEIQSVF